MKNVKFAILYRPLHPESGEVFRNADEVPVSPNQYDSQNQCYQFQPGLSGTNRIQEDIPDVLCYITRTNFLGMELPADPTRSLDCVFPQPKKLDIPNVWVEFNTYRSLPDTIKAATEIVKIYGAENIMIVKKIDHRMVFQID